MGPVMAFSSTVQYAFYENKKVYALQSILLAMGKIAFKTNLGLITVSDI